MGGPCGNAAALVLGPEALMAGDFPQPITTPAKKMNAKIPIVFRAIIGAILTAREELAAQIESNRQAENSIYPRGKCPSTKFENHASGWQQNSRARERHSNRTICA